MLTRRASSLTPVAFAHRLESAPNHNESHMFNPSSDYQPTDNERNAMRAYLQRTEVRLSTLHRIAGAGLLFLFPIFFKDEITALLNVFITFAVEQFPQLGQSDQALAVVMVLTLGYPFVLSGLIPIYALYLLLKDVIHFYFTIYSPGFPASLFTPSFVLAGITLPTDEAPEAKKQVYAHQYNPSAINFMIPFSAEKRELYFDETIENTNGEIIPKSRQWAQLQASGSLPPDADRRTVEHFNTAFGLARTLDRSLIDEVATTEASVVRHVLYLRRLVLRYMKTLLMLIWTTVVTFTMLPFLQELRLPTFLFMAIGYLIWAICAPLIMKMPLQWIYRHRKRRVERQHIDRQMNTLERQMTRFCYVAIVSAAAGLVLSIVFYS
jgi:hypothetical protein